MVDMAPIFVSKTLEKEFLESSSIGFCKVIGPGGQGGFGLAKAMGPMCFWPLAFGHVLYLNLGVLGCRFGFLSPKG